MCTVMFSTLIQELRAQTNIQIFFYVKVCTILLYCLVGQYAFWDTAFKCTS